MKNLLGSAQSLLRLTALTSIVLIAGCFGEKDPILGGGGLATLAPAVTVVSPLPGEVGVSVNTKVISVAFTKAMDPSTINASSLKMSCPPGVPLTTGVVSYVAAGSVATISLPANSQLAASTTCSVTVSANAKDELGHPLLNDFTWSFTTGLLPDTTPPTVTSTIHANGATNVPINTSAGATFSEPMDPATVNLTTFTLQRGAELVPGRVVYQGVTAIFIPSAVLASNTLYTATITSGARDAAGNAMVTPFVWNWTTSEAPDTTPPTVTGTVNANGATDVAVNTKIGATFSEGLDPLTINSATMTVKAAVSGVPVLGLVSYSGVSAVFVPLTALDYSTAYIVMIKGGIDGVRDLAGNPMISDFFVRWTTSDAPDTTAPTVTGTIHANGATNVAINTKVGATFSEGMDPLTVTNVNFTVREALTGASVAGTVTYTGVSAVFTPQNVLANSREYVVTVKGGATGVKDLAGNAMVSNFEISWTTSQVPDTTAPTVTGTSHQNGASNVPLNTRVGVTFSEGMDPLTVTNLTFSLTENGKPLAIAGTVSYSGVSAVFAPINDLLPGKTYTVSVKGGTAGVKDLAGNPMVGDFVVQWTTVPLQIVDTTPPTVTATTHQNGATNVAINTRVGVTFSEVLYPLSVTNLTFFLTEAGQSSPIAGTISYSGVSAVFVPLNDLSKGRSYTVTVKGGGSGIRDLSGNAMAQDFSVTWSTVPVPDTTRPRVIGTIHQNGDTNVPVNTQVGATFSEALDPVSVNNTSFLLKETVSGNGVPGTVNYSGVNAVFVPLNPLANSTSYTVTVRSGSGGVVDLAGNGMISDFTNSWTTANLADIVPPTVTSTNPLSGATGICINKAISATFSEAIDPLTVTNVNYSLAETSGVAIAGVVGYDALSRIATYTPAANLAPATNYTATIKGGVSGIKDLAGNPMVVDQVTTFTTGASACTAAVALGAAAPFGGFGGGAGMTSQGLLTVIDGDIGTTGVSTTVTGLHDSVGDVYTETPLNVGTVNGRIYTAAPPPGGSGVGGNATTFAIASAAALAARDTYDNKLSPAALPGGVDPGAGQLGGLTLFPGIYKAAGGTFLLTGSDLTLDAQGDANAVWVFQTAAGLTIGAPGFPRSVILANGAKAKNVFWYVGSAARIENRSSMVGTIIADAGVTISTPGEAQITTLEGRALGLNASVTVVNTVITLPSP